MRQLVASCRRDQLSLQPGILFFESSQAARQFLTLHSSKHLH